MKNMKIKRNEIIIALILIAFLVIIPKGVQELKLRGLVKLLSVATILFVTKTKDNDILFTIDKLVKVKIKIKTRK